MAENKQVRKLTDTQKAEIVLAKEIRPTATSTNKNLAAEFDVSESLIDHLNYSALSDNQKAIYNQKKQDLVYLAQDLTYNAMREANKRVINGDGKLSEVVGAMKIGHDIYRLESGQSTTNVSVQGTYELRCREYLEAIVKHDPGASVERKREYLLNSSALADVPVEVREKIEIS